MRPFNVIIIAILIAGFSGCEDPIEVPIPAGPQKHVVEGWITNEEKKHEIRVTTTVPFSDSQNFQVVNDATVQILTGSGKAVLLSATGDGYYQSDSSWMGQTNERYACRIQLSDGRTIVSTFEQLVSVPPIDSILFRPKEPPTIINGIILEEYLVTGFISDPAGSENFYRWRVFLNGRLLSEPGEIVLFNDRFVDGNQFSIEPGQFIFQPGDTIEIGQYALTETAFDYYSLLVAQATTLGQSSGTAPAILQGNLSVEGDGETIVLGFFGASSVTYEKK